MDGNCNRRLAVLLLGYSEQVHHMAVLADECLLNTKALKTCPTQQALPTPLDSVAQECGGEAKRAQEPSRFAWSE
jgi:hypothetical protein